jgi:hypothetical protein
MIDEEETKGKELINEFEPADTTGRTLDSANLAKHKYDKYPAAKVRKHCRISNTLAKIMT